MTRIDIGSLVLAWWNTSLSPPITRKKVRYTASDQQFVSDLIIKLFRESGFSLLGLCELNKTSLRQIEAVAKELNLSVLDVTGQDGRMVLDVAMLYDDSQLEFLEWEHWTERYGRRVSLKVGTSALFRNRQTGILFQIVASHWPSRMNLPEGDSRRAQLGAFLKGKIQEIRNVSDGRYVVLMGDYNDEPFSKPLSEFLLATRDRSLAKKDSAYFYNPFWRHLGESIPHLQPSKEGGDVCGTHFFKNGAFSTWVTFDQILFSSEFLKDGQVVLDEALSRIYVTPELREKVLSGSIINHFPVISAIKLRASNE